jgi:hypothetical protein
MERFRTYSIFLFLLTSISVAGQKQASLKEQLWERVNPCMIQFQDKDGDGQLDYAKIDDARNGFLYVVGSFPGCDCSCSSRVGAYKNEHGEYVFLQYDEEDCSWKRKMSSNKALRNILPEDFGLNDFVGEELVLEAESPTFFLHLEIPRKGTDTEATLELIPLGLRAEGDRPVVTEYVGNTRMDQHRFLSRMKTLAATVTNEATLERILRGEFDRIPERDVQPWLTLVGDRYGQFATKELLRETLIQLKKKYDLHSALRFQKIVLGWDREQSRFFVKEKVPRTTEPPSFRKFLLEAVYWDVKC